MYVIESTNILTPQNGLNIYRGRTEDSMILTEIPNADPYDIGVKTDAPEQLVKALKRRRRGSAMIQLGSMGDPYNVYEEDYGLVRSCLKIIEMYDFGVTIYTKQNRIIRDLDVLSGIARKTKCVVEIPISTLNSSKMERIEGSETISPSQRLKLIKKLADVGIDVIVSLYPIIPYVNDSEEDLVNLVETLAETPVKGINLCDLRLVIKTSLREKFYNEFKLRFPKEYREFIAEFEEAGELYARNSKQILPGLENICDRNGKLHDASDIKEWKRHYENKTVGEQLSFTII